MLEEGSCAPTPPDQKGAGTTVTDARPSLLLGVDGGGTHTRAVLADTAGRVLGRGEAGTANQATAGATAAVRAIVSAVRSACAVAGCRPEGIAAACFGLAGLDRPGDEEAFLPAVAELGLPHAAALVNDSVIAWAGATGGEPGVAVIAGTGSVAYGRNPGGAEHRAGGWGGPFGDEGSAFWIATEGIRRVLRAVDRRAGPTDLAIRLTRAAGFDHPADLCLLARADRAAGGLPMETEIASLAPVVVAAAAAGDADAVAVVRGAARELADLATAVVAALSLAPAHQHVHGLGSVLHQPGSAATPVALATGERLRAVLGVPLLPPRHNAAAGALILAAARARGGEPPEPAVVRAWADSL